MHQTDLNLLVNASCIGNFVEHFCFEANLKDVVFVGGKGKLASGSHFLIVQNVTLGVKNLQLGVVPVNLSHVVISFDENVLVDLLFQALLVIRWQIEHERVYLRHTQGGQNTNVKVYFHSK